MRPKPVVLCIRDGWGIRKQRTKNAVLIGKTPFTDDYKLHYPTCVLKCHGKDVGLPKGYQGNSEVGHLNLGSGRIVYQMLTKINRAVEDGSFFRNKALLKAVTNCKKHKSTLHIMGLVQDQGVHAHQDHCIALLELARRKKLKDCVVHVFSDGRDTPPKSSLSYIKKVAAAMKQKKVGKFGVVVGRYYAMDRDKRWHRTRIAYDALAYGKGKPMKTVTQAVKDAYKAKETDEFIKPRIVGGFKGIKNNDSIIFFNFRLDRARQITHAFTDKKFAKFPRKKLNITYICFSPYYAPLPVPHAFEEAKLRNVLGEVLSKKGLKQLRSAETEKYAHVTYFFNGEVEKPFKGEARHLVPSPKVATYDLKPEMSAYKVTKVVVDAIKKRAYDVIIVNLANGDMVGHTGVWRAALKAVNVVDACVHQIVEATKQQKGVVFLTSDHGNCEEMSGIHQTSHTLNDVFLHVIGYPCKLRNGKLADVAPTLLHILEIKKPKEMTGRSLLV